MTYSLVASLAFDLALAIHRKVSEEIPSVVQRTRANLCEDITEYSLSYAVSEDRDPFCVLCISVSQFEPPELFFEVDVDYESHCIEDQHKPRTYDAWITDYADKWPVMTNGFVDYLGTDENEKIHLDKHTAKQRLNVRYHVTGNAVGEIDGYRDICGFDEVANTVCPYIKSLYDLFNDSSR
ncbi:hypothetical protein [Nitrosopumilus sp.]|uniref:hypothetical protein n=1 Tax=Nitrosopumilus sp. TaxID=2024843 RepID=UPI0034A04170